MDKFYTKAALYEIPTFKEFAREFKLCSKDVILTHKFLCDAYMKDAAPDCQYLFYEQYETGEPTETMLDQLLVKVNAIQPERIIGIGGGSVLDAAKLLSIDNVKTSKEIFEPDPSVFSRKRGLILSPTTCGTGSEMDGISAIYLNSMGAKIGRSFECNVADASVLIPQLLENLPYNLFMYGACDALIHGMEIYMSPFGNVCTNVYCAETVRLNVRNFKRMKAEGKDKRKELMIEFMRASAYAGIGLSHNPCGFVHACAMYFGGEHHTPHGKTNAIFMGPVMRVYAKKKPDGLIKDLAKIICEEMGLQTDVYGAMVALEDMINELLPREHLKDLGMPQGKAKDYAQKVFDTQNRLVIQGYTPLTLDELAGVFEELY